MKNMKKQQGFTLIELLIVVAIIAIIAAIAIPNLLTARMSANETSAIGSLRTITSAQAAYSAVNNGNYGSISDLVNGGYLDARYGSSGEISGYEIVEVGGTTSIPKIVPNNATFRTGLAYYAAVPVSGSAGRYCYGVGPDMVIRYLDTTPTPAAGSITGTCSSNLPSCGSSGCSAGDPVSGKIGTAGSTN